MATSAVTASGASSTSVLENSVAARNDGAIALVAIVEQEEKCIKQMIAH